MSVSTNFNTIARVWVCMGVCLYTLISSCLWMRPLLLSLKSTCASLYFVITSTNFRDKTACCKDGGGMVRCRDWQTNCPVQWWQCVCHFYYRDKRVRCPPVTCVSSCQPKFFPPGLSPNFSQWLNEWNKQKNHKKKINPFQLTSLVHLSFHVLYQ